MAKALIAIIQLYRSGMPHLRSFFTVQTDCKFYPSCSHYAEEALLKRGVIKGLQLSFKRMLRCQPWSAPQVDLVP